VLFAKGYGFADLENEVTATEHTVYRIGSITKQFTAAVILQLAEQGKLNLDDNIRHFLPSYDTHSYTITIRQLLNHTSGIRSFTELPAFQARDRLDFSPESLFAIFQHEPLDSHRERAFSTTTQPSTFWESSSSGSRGNPTGITCENMSLRLLACVRPTPARTHRSSATALMATG
jgi:CubicO group peptidase (beta-lactamase class C family)